MLADWHLSEAEPASSVPICWSKAYGGQIPGTGDPQTETPADVEARNPLGCGIVNLDMPWDQAPVAAPQITLLGQTLNWREPTEPQGLGLVSPWWRSRQQHAGTYDDVWLNERHPLLPEDFDARFWQCAHPDLVAAPYLSGDEDYELDHLHPSFAQATGRLPGITLGVRCVGQERDEWYLLSLDGVHFDWRNDNRVMLTWRTRFPLQEAGQTSLTLTRVQIKAADDAHPDGAAA